MATQNKTGTTVTSGVPSINDLGAFNAGNSSYVTKNSVDLTGEAPGDTDGEIYQCLAIPADTLVLNVFLKIITPAVGTSLAIDVGDGTVDNDWDDAVDAKGTAGTVTYGITATDDYVDGIGATQGKLYTTADTIDVVFEAATGITAGPKFEIYALCTNLNFKSSV